MKNYIRIISLLLTVMLLLGSFMTVLAVSASADELDDDWGDDWGDDFTDDDFNDDVTGEPDDDDFEERFNLARNNICCLHLFFFPFLCNFCKMENM